MYTLPVRAGPSAADSRPSCCLIAAAASSVGAAAMLTQMNF